MKVLFQFALFAIIFSSIAFCQDEMNIQVSGYDNGAQEQINLSNSFDDESDINEESKDLCSELKCSLGERCIIENNEAKCDCIESCVMANDERHKICSSSNKTYDSDCHFYRQKCLCKRKDKECSETSILEDTLDYYGKCRYIEDCSEEERSVFPDRMKIWLDEVLHILNERKDLDPKYSNLVELAEQMKQNNTEKYWTCGVAFEFCQLDLSQDHLIQKEELRALISTIKSFENCIQPFLDECDTNKDDAISDKEWGACLDLNEDDLELLRKHC